VRTRPCTPGPALASGVPDTGEVGDKKAYDPRSWGKAAEAGMSARVVQACEDLMSAGQRLT
jgi:fructose/tagatose bisphosphate aldolase